MNITLLSKLNFENITFTIQNNFKGKEIKHFFKLIFAIISKLRVYTMQYL